MCLVARDRGRLVDHRPQFSKRITLRVVPEEALLADPEPEPEYQIRGRVDQDSFTFIDSTGQVWHASRALDPATRRFRGRLQAIGRTVMVLGNGITLVAHH